ncbi:MAG: putative hydrolase or acyltransferase of alpha/beta superfamily [Jatrophihabitans sp.]|nr:putative hydrolase or acyltransferase of alpha/beta superfamily [Jatrophihabitans sp.]
MPEASEFDSLVEAADELGLDPRSIPPIAREYIDVALDGAAPSAPLQRLSLLRWGSGEPELVLLHGGGQNAHTWDLVLLLLGRPAVAIDLPGHGHSAWRADRDYGPVRNADAVAIAIEQYAPRAAAVIGMSLGGLTTIHLAATRPKLVRRAVLVDVAPGSPQAAAAMNAEQRGTVQLTRGPKVFDSRDEMVEAAVAAAPQRAASAVRRGVVHNSHQLPNGRWAWRYDRPDPGLPFPTGELWEDVARMTMPTMLVTGADSRFVTDADKAEMTHHLPSIRVETVAGAGHTVQSDQPKALAALIADFVVRAKG